MTLLSCFAFTFASSGSYLVMISTTWRSGLTLLFEHKDVEDSHPLLVVLRVEDLVEPGVPLLLVEELNQLGGGDSVCLADRLEHVVDVCSRADGLVDLVEHLIGGKCASPQNMKLCVQIQYLGHLPKRCSTQSRTKQWSNIFWKVP